MSLPQTLEETLKSVAVKTPDHTAIVIPGEVQITYADLWAQVDSLKNQLIHEGFGKDDIIAFVLPNNLEYMVLFYAVTATRATAAPLNSAYKIDDFTFYLKDTQAKLVIVGKNFSESHESITAAKSLSIPVSKVFLEGKTVKLEFPTKSSSSGVAASPSSPSDVALFLHTSGTTSVPKGVPLTQANLVASMTNIAQTYELTPSDCTLLVMPLFHVHGLLGAAMSTLVSGGTVIVPPKFSATTFWQHVNEYNVTWYSAVPTIHQILLLREEQSGKPFSGKKLRFIRSCSSSLAPSQLQKLEETFGAPVLEAYGMTEASHQMASNPLPKAGVSKPGSVGKGTNVKISIRKPTEDVELPVGEAGEVCIIGKNVTAGYHNRPDANKECFTPSGWFRTGDQGILDSGGYLTLTGRIKELINRGGEKISPLELDGVLLSHPKVAEAVTFGAPDTKYGEQVNCAIVPKEGENVNEQEIINFCKTKLADFKVPVKVFLANELPKTATGKTQRRFVASHFLSSNKN